MLKITEKEIDRALPEVEEGLAKYQWLQENLYNTDVSTDRAYQRRFNHFYRVRRSPEWQLVFFELLEETKSNPISFSEALEALQNTTGRLEASFGSKLVATVDPELPIIDHFVLKNCGLRLPYSGTKDRMLKIVAVYKALSEQLTEILSGDCGDYLVSRFSSEYPDARVTKIKMLDLVLWKMR